MIARATGILPGSDSESHAIEGGTSRRHAFGSDTKSSTGCFALCHSLKKQGQGVEGRSIGGVLEEGAYMMRFCF